MTFEEIEARREQHGLTRKALYDKAGLHKETWRRTATGRTEPNSRTLRKLSEALDALTAGLASSCPHWRDGRCEACGEAADGYEVPAARECPAFSERRAA